MFTETKAYCEHRNKYDNKIENRTPHLGHAHWKLGFTLKQTFIYLISHDCFNKDAKDYLY